MYPQIRIIDCARSSGVEHSLIYGVGTGVGSATDVGDKTDVEVFVGLGLGVG